MTGRRHLLMLLGIVVVPAAIVTALASASPAWAYMTADGSGTAQVGVGTLSPPTKVRVTSAPGSGTTRVTWRRSTPPAGHAPTGYRVTRVRTRDGAKADACGTSASALTRAATCHDRHLADGGYRYVVTAVFRTWTAASRPSSKVSVVRDTIPPATTLTDPDEATGWAHGCPAPGLCGTASDVTGVASVSVAIQQLATGLFWDGSSFDRRSETFVAATGTTRWSLALARPPAGAYTVRVRATDNVGNGNTTPSGPATTFTVEPSVPAAPSITAPAPAGTEMSPSWSFMGAPGGSFRCALTRGASTVSAFAPCTSPRRYALADGDGIYTFRVRQLDGAGEAGPEASSDYTLDTVAPTLVSLRALDTDGNGRLDRVRARFNEPLAASTATGPWTLTDVPGAGSLVSVGTSGQVATLALREGAETAGGQPDSFTVALAAAAGGITDAAGNQASFAAQVPVGRPLRAPDDQPDGDQPEATPTEDGSRGREDPPRSGPQPAGRAEGQAQPAEHDQAGGPGRRDPGRPAQPRPVGRAARPPAPDGPAGAHQQQPGGAEGERHAGPVGQHQDNP
jgi:hypothetical protein